MIDHVFEVADAAKLVACGACGGEAKVELLAVHGYEDSYGRRYLVETHQALCPCGAAAQRAETPTLAVAAWNAMWAGRAGEATGLAWTVEPPVKPGWYWMKTSDDSRAIRMIEYSWPRPNPPEYRFAGPIPEPVELGIAPSPDGGDISTRSP